MLPIRRGRLHQTINGGSVVARHGEEAARLKRVLQAIVVLCRGPRLQLISHARMEAAAQPQCTSQATYVRCGDRRPGCRCCPELGHKGPAGCAAWPWHRPPPSSGEPQHKHVMARPLGLGKRSGARKSHPGFQQKARGSNLGQDQELDRAGRVANLLKEIGYHLGAFRGPRFLKKRSPRHSPSPRPISPGYCRTHLDNTNGFVWVAQVFQVDAYDREEVVRCLVRHRGFTETPIRL